MMNEGGRRRMPEDAILPDVTVKPFTGIRFKTPRPPDHSTASESRTTKENGYRSSSNAGCCDTGG